MRWLPTSIAVALAVTAGVVIVMQRLELTRLGYELGKADRENIRLSEDLRRLDSVIASMTSLESIRDKVVEFGLNLVPPGEKKS